MSDPSPFFDLLDTAGLTTPNGPNDAAVLGRPFGDLAEILVQAYEVTAASLQPPSKGPFGFSATHSLAGAPRPCGDLRCRTRKVQDLAVFATMYADEVTICNQLTSYILHPTPKKYQDQAKRMILDDLRVLHEIRPAVEAGHIRIISPDGGYCADCLTKHLFGPTGPNQLRRVRRNLRNRIRDNIAITAAQTDLGTEITLSGDIDILEHDRSMIYRACPRALRDNKDLRQRIATGEVVVLDAEARRRLGLDKDMAEEVLTDLFLEMTLAQQFGTSYLIDRQILGHALTALSGSEEQARINDVIRENLTGLVPFLGDLRLDQLSLLREREGDAFIRFRAAFRGMIRASLDEGEMITPRRAQEIHADHIAPRLAELDQRVAAARKHLITDPAVTAVGLTAAVGFGIYSGLIGPNFGEVAKGIGLLSAAAKSISGAARAAAEKDHIWKDDLFFLWKARQLSKAR